MTHKIYKNNKLQRIHLILIILDPNHFLQVHHPSSSLANEKLNQNLFQSLFSTLYLVYHPRYHKKAHLIKMNPELSFVEHDPKLLISIGNNNKKLSYLLTSVNDSVMFFMMNIFYYSRYKDWIVVMVTNKMTSGWIIHKMISVPVSIFIHVFYCSWYS